MSKFIMSRRQMLALSSVAAMAGLAGCGGNAAPADGGDAAPAADGDVKSLTFVPGKLTVAIGNPAWEPWVMNDAPESGEGFEAALIYALAKQMGFADEEVVWTRTEFDEACAPGQHEWDLNIQQVSINEDRAKAVDFSPAYFVPTQALIVRGDGKFANATTCAEFDGATIAVMVGTTADTFVAAAMPGAKIEYFNNNSDAGLGITLPLGSPLTPYVTDAMNAILDDSTVQGLIDTWLKAYTSDIPVLA